MFFLRLGEEPQGRHEVPATEALSFVSEQLKD